MVRSILWFRQDLRLHDNEALSEAIRSSDELLPVFIFDPVQFAQKTIYGTSKTGVVRTRFLIESVTELRQQLRDLGSDLIVRRGKPSSILFSLASDHKVHYIYCNRERTREEVVAQDKLEKKLWTIGGEVRYSRGKMLYYTSDLPFPVTHCPDSFVIFKKEVDQHIPVRSPLISPDVIPPLPEEIDPGIIPAIEDLLPRDQPHESFFTGGETAGLNALHHGVHLPSYFLANGGSMLSPWIANGSLSPKELYYAATRLKDGDQIQQHLIYRDYLRLMGKKYGNRIFFKNGIREVQISYRKDPDKLKSWQEGKTGVEIIDAGMAQLNYTGWLSEYMRRLVAGYFIKVLQLDWRLGAAYFEAKLIDYDPCTNWVSWMNIAGVGPDTRDDRIVNYDAVGKRLDPDGSYVNRWLELSNP